MPKTTPAKTAVKRPTSPLSGSPRSYDDNAIATTPNESPIDVTVDGEVPETKTSHSTGTLDITTAAAGAVERKDPREYATYNNKMPAPLATPAKAPYTRSEIVGLPDQNTAATAITTTPASSTVEVTSLGRLRFVTLDAKKSLNPIENVESTA
jgi:hypothetical protein